MSAPFWCSLLSMTVIFHAKKWVRKFWWLQKAITDAYLFSRKDCKLDYIIQSMDKNFMVPVGGSIILGENKNEWEVRIKDW